MATAQARALLPVLAPVVAAAGAELEDVTVSQAGRRPHVVVVIDSPDGADRGLDLDAVAVVSRIVGEALDDNDTVLPGAYTLEVTTPGVDRPLTRPRHWRHAVGRLVTVTRADGREVTGRVSAADDAGAVLLVAEGELPVSYAEVRRAAVQVEFNRPGGAAGEGP
jgi:ribosome maturation factor RimP